MTANISLEQFVHLKQPACDYLAQGYEISHQLNDLIEALKEIFLHPLFIRSFTLI